jgi:hypothetical protein
MAQSPTTQIERGESRPKGSAPATIIPEHHGEMGLRCAGLSGQLYVTSVSSQSVFAVLISRQRGLSKIRSGRSHLTNWK